MRQQAAYFKTRGYLLQTTNFTNSNAKKRNIETNIQTENTSGESNKIKVTKTINGNNNTKTPPVEQTYYVKLIDADHKLFETLQERLFEKIA